MDVVSFLFGALAVSFVWYCFTPWSRVTWLKGAIRAEVKQGPTHDKKIGAIYAIVREAAREEFSEDNEITLDDFLREWFERTQFEGLYQEGRAILAENARFRAAIQPLITHADAPDTAPPLRLSVGDCKKIKEMADG